MADDNLVSIKGDRTDAGERAAKAWQMRVIGGTWEAIARQLGYADAPSVHRAVKRYFGTVPHVDREMLREMARQRGEHLWRRAFQQVEATEGAPAAIRAATELLRRMSALDGLDEPTKLDVHSPDPEEFTAFIAAAARGLGVALPVEADPFAEEYNVIDADVVEDEGSSV